MVQVAIILLLIAILLTTIYQIRLNKRINTKLIALMKPDRDVRKIAKQSRDEAWQHYRQSEYYSQLLLALKPTAALPPLRSWAASADLLLTLFYLARNSHPTVVVDLGSGASTLVLAKAVPTATIVSIDHSPEFAQKTQQMLNDHGVTNVDVRVAPLTALASGATWYHPDAWSSLSQIDLLFIDGPPGSRDDSARHPAFTELCAKLTPQAIVVIDDVHRDGENQLAQKFAAELPNHRLEILNHEKGTAVIRPK